MIVLTAYGQLQEDGVEMFLEASHENKAKAQAEAGCEKFDYYLSAEEPLKFVFVEEWASMEHLEAHFATEHFARFMASMQECLAAPPDIRIFDATLRP
ncbi:MAG: antibiotic biosynthesis monooxygenase [Chthonomonas sp.]|nr:antibiotic biosynthesis monooxygenase [Chthonomonas sp.]